MKDETAVEKAERLLSEIEASEGAILRSDDSALAKANSLLTEIERHEAPTDVLTKVKPSQIRELAQRLNVDPDAPNALAELRKVAGARPMFVEAYLAEPLPAKTLGAGASLAMSKEKIETLAKARGYRMSEADWKRGIIE